MRKEASPVLRLALSIIYSPNYDVRVLLPTPTYSLPKNRDLELIGQSVWVRLPDQPFAALEHAFYLRLKRNY